MGKFTALILKYPRLLFELKNNNQLLADLEKLAIDQSPGLNNSIMPLKEKGSASYWINNYPKTKQLLFSKMKSNNNDKKYIFEKGAVKKLLQVSPQGISPKYFKLRELLGAGHKFLAEEKFKLAAEKFKEANDETFALIFQANKIKKYLSVFWKEAKVGLVATVLVEIIAVTVSTGILSSGLLVSILVRLLIGLSSTSLLMLIVLLESLQETERRKIVKEVISKDLPSGLTGGIGFGLIVGMGVGIIVGVIIEVSALILALPILYIVVFAAVVLPRRFPLLRLSDFEYSLYSEATENFPSDDLRTIDQLWVKYSEGKYGFSVQKKIYHENDRTGSEIEVLNNFYESLGWQKQRQWLLHNDLNLELDGVLPCLWTAEIPSLETKQKKQQKNLLIIDRNSEKGIKEKALKLYLSILSKDL
ncbi:MAG: hypothetical protein F6K40_22950 [Okeania sp. SIO3I5]|nr:hypothetical protein [Okeania sp. SIO3I5]